ncbi:MAG: hypothetical protein JRJ87_24085 [Deltaproteobacteria bacterium]|nr:hypothetical protein [Deltaproteobacteria bacterium]
MNKEQLYKELAENTVSIDNLGGFGHFLDETNPYAIVADVRQRSFDRFLDGTVKPGGIRFDPFLRELEMRGRVFQAELIGSLGRSDWLWAHKNPFLKLSDEQSTVCRALADKWKSVVLGVMCVDFPGQDRMLVQHRLAGVCVGLGLGDAYYVANDSQTYVILPGQIPLTDPLTDINFAIDDALFEQRASQKNIAMALDMLAIPFTKQGDIWFAEREGKKLRMKFDAAGFVSERQLVMG